MIVVLEQFSNPCGVTNVVQGGLFLGKKPLEVGGFPLLQLENRYIGVKPKKRKCKYGYERISLVGLARMILRIGNSIPARKPISSRNFCDSYSVFMGFQ
jgi:hypothetical protein